ncbi:MAG: hypothetical protein M1814_005227 [Vezdaea aestivalis]|nr:MAG: hypothetical protein M1814_005227 [Vezdaea aestivalis]
MIYGFWDQLIGWWHSYRTPLIYGALVILFAVRITIHSRHDRIKLSDSPQLNLVKSNEAVPSEKESIKTSDEKFATSKLVKTARGAPKRVAGNKKVVNPLNTPQKAEVSKIQVLIFYSSLTGTTESLAKSWHTTLCSRFRANKSSKLTLLQPELHDLFYIDYDDYFVNPPADQYPANTFLCYLLLVPSYDIDTPLALFLTHLNETHTDFRINTAPLSGLLGYSVFGFGDREGWPTEEDGFCFQAKEIDRWMAKLTGRKRIYPLGLGDAKRDGDQPLNNWWTGVEEVLVSIDGTGSLGEGVEGSGDAVESEEEDDYKPSKTRKTGKLNGVTSREPNNRVDDMEDLGGMAQAAPLPIDFTTYGSQPTKELPKAMVPMNSPTYKSLTKQGYSIIGTHSGVKLCRWTKSALRGRGSCYKYSFYGIASHRCMEATPSLSCSNKCVFCWRHGTNPVGTTWRWTVDPPDEIYNGIKAAHYEKIKVMRGVPGVRADRYSEALDIRHCALSLVGEPLFYPHINQLLSRLHDSRISTFLVCNAQHPSHLRDLDMVTQLYVSIDASNPESLKRIDRPLHRDYWARFLSCLDILREKRHTQRTVFRLTLVKGFNIEEAGEYAELVSRGQPGFIEIKGVTYCGTTSAAGAGLSMENVPFWEEVVSFTSALSTALESQGLSYKVAAEHSHSCCILLAKEEFRDWESGKWRSWIDYEKFFELIERRKISGENFGPLDYIGAETPEWAAEGAGGFDPRDTRVWRKGKNKKPLPDGMGDFMRVVEEK